MLDEFQFEADERVFSCYVATLGRKSEESWWWFSVSGDSNRYAPFRRLTSDTPADVQYRVVAYYRDRLAPRAAPLYRGWHQRKA
jgi:hypothetical protein